MTITSSLEETLQLFSDQHILQTRVYPRISKDRSLWPQSTERDSQTENIILALTYLLYNPATFLTEVSVIL